MFRLTISKVFIAVLAAIASYSGANAAVEEALGTASEAVNNAMGTANDAVNNAMGTANDAVSNAMGGVGDILSNLKDTNETDTEADAIMDEAEADESSSAAYGMLAGAVFSVLATVVSL